MSLSQKDNAAVIGPVQMQTPEEEGCSEKRKQYTDEDFLYVCEVDLGSDFDEEEDDLRRAKLLAELEKIYKEDIDLAIASRKKPECETSIKPKKKTTGGKTKTCY